MDLKQRGLLDETLIICGGEFGRTPTVQLNQQGSGASWGRDHNPWGFSLWLAGGGIKRGVTIGETDDFCYNIVKDGVLVGYQVDRNMARLRGLPEASEEFAKEFHGVERFAAHGLDGIPEDCFDVSDFYGHGWPASVRCNLILAREFYT